MFAFCLGPFPSLIVLLPPTVVLAAKVPVSFFSSGLTSETSNLDPSFTVLGCVPSALLVVARERYLPDGALVLVRRRLLFLMESVSFVTPSLDSSGP